MTALRLHQKIDLGRHRHRTDSSRGYLPVLLATLAKAPALSAERPFAMVRRAFPCDASLATS